MPRLQSSESSTYQMTDKKIPLNLPWALYSLVLWLSVKSWVSSNSLFRFISIWSVLGTSDDSAELFAELFNLVRNASSNLRLRWSVCVIFLVCVCSFASEFVVPRVSNWIFSSEFSMEFMMATATVFYVGEDPGNEGDFSLKAQASHASSPADKSCVVWAEHIAKVLRFS